MHDIGIMNFRTISGKKEKQAIYSNFGHLDLDYCYVDRMRCDEVKWNVMAIYEVEL